MCGQKKGLTSRGGMKWDEIGWWMLRESKSRGRKGVDEKSSWGFCGGGDGGGGGGRGKGEGVGLACFALQISKAFPRQSLYPQFFGVRVGGGDKSF